MTNNPEALPLESARPRSADILPAASTSLKRPREDDEDSLTEDEDSSSDPDLPSEAETEYYSHQPFFEAAILYLDKEPVIHRDYLAFIESLEKDATEENRVSKGVLIQLRIDNVRSGWFYLSFEKDLYLTRVYAQDFNYLFTFKEQYPNAEPWAKSDPRNPTHAQRQENLRITLGTIKHWFANDGDLDHTNNRIPPFIISEAIRFESIKAFVHLLLLNCTSTISDDWWFWEPLLHSWDDISKKLIEELSKAEGTKICGITNQDIIEYVDSFRATLLTKVEESMNKKVQKLAEIGAAVGEDKPLERAPKRAKLETEPERIVELKTLREANVTRIAEIFRENTAVLATAASVSSQNKKRDRKSIERLSVGEKKNTPPVTSARKSLSPMPLRNSLSARRSLSFFDEKNEEPQAKRARKGLK